MTQAAQEIWLKITEELKKTLSPQSFETWIKPLKPIGLKDDVLSVEAPNKFFKDWLVEHYQ